MGYEVQLLLFLTIVIVVSKLSGHLVQRYLNQPVVFGEILAGLLLGPTLLNIFHWPVFANSAEELSHQIHALAGVGVLLLMFIAGVETNFDEMRKVGRTACWAAMGGVFAPLFFGTLTARLFGLSFTESIFIGTVLTATSVSITAQTLMEIGRLREKEGAAILGAAVIDDVLGILVLSFVVAFGAAHVVLHDGGGPARLADLLAERGAAMLGLAPGGALLNILVIVLLMGVFFAFAVFAGPRLVRRVLASSTKLHASHAVPAAALALVFLFAVGAEYLGQVAAIIGAYLVGIFVGQTNFRHKVERGIHPFTYALFVPIFFMSIGLGADARQLGGSIPFVIAIVVVAILTKVVGCGVGARLTGFTSPQALRVGVGMISRGEVGLIVAQVGLVSQVIKKPEYAALVIMVLATTIITPILLRLSFPRVREVQADVYESVVAIESEETDEALEDRPSAEPAPAEDAPAPRA